MNVNVVALTGNLTRDPELRTTGSGTSVCSLRIAVNERAKIGGEWTDKPNYFDVTVWGNQGEACAKYLEKGAPVAIQGRLQWREWQTQDGGKRQAVDVVAERCQFLNRGDGSGGGGGGGGQAQADVPADTRDLPPSGGTPPPTGGADDDIPF
jgi:single-strand DNA-binding protein